MGRVHYGKDNVGGDHVVAVLGEQVSDAYLAELRQDGVSYIFAGAKGDDLAGAMEQLASRFGASKLLLEGGGRINGAFLKHRLIDEFSTLIFPPSTASQAHRASSITTARRATVPAPGRLAVDALRDARGRNGLAASRRGKDSLDRRYPRRAAGGLTARRHSWNGIHHVLTSTLSMPDRPGFSPTHTRFSALPGASAPGCRFAGRSIPRTSGKLANVWSPDAVNDARGMDDCAVFVAPRRPGA